MNDTARAVVMGAILVLGVILSALPGGCASSHRSSTLSTKIQRRGDEIVVCGQMVHTGAPVVLWTDLGGYDAYRTPRRVVPAPGTGKAEASGPKGARHSSREAVLSTAELDRLKTEGWTLDLLRRHVDQFVIHYDACGTSRECFRVLQDVRGLSVHFLLDLDGTIYQTLDVKERAWHATTSNDRSVGVEIANIGAFRVGEKDPFDRWYVRDGAGEVRVTIPAEMGGGGIRTRGFVARPARTGVVVGEIHGKPLRMYDLTPQQYESLARLTAALCTVFPNLPCDYPRDDHGAVVTRRLSDERLKTYRGLLGHFHIQENKADPGPAFDWERVVEGARRIMQDASVGNRAATGGSEGSEGT